MHCSSLKPVPFNGDDDFSIQMKSAEYIASLSHAETKSGITCTHLVRYAEADSYSSSWQGHGPKPDSEQQHRVDRRHDDLATSPGAWATDATHDTASVESACRSSYDVNQYTKIHRRRCGPDLELS